MRNGKDLLGWWAVASYSITARWHCCPLFPTSFQYRPRIKKAICLWDEKSDVACNSAVEKKKNVDSFDGWKKRNFLQNLGSRGTVSRSFQMQRSVVGMRFRLCFLYEQKATERMSKWKQNLISIHRLLQGKRKAVGGAILLELMTSQDGAGSAIFLCVCVFKAAPSTGLSSLWPNAWPWA